MATKTDSEASGCNIVWQIQNISHCWKEHGECIDGPAFTADAVGGSKWSLQLYPKGRFYETNIDVFLKREEDCGEPEVIKIRYQSAFLSKDGEFLKQGLLYTETFKGNQSRFAFYEKRGTVFVTEREAFLPEDTLTVQCTLQKEGETIVKSKQITARTIFSVKRKSFIWKINDFSTLRPGVRNKFKDHVIDIDMVLNEGLDFEKRLVVEGIAFHESIKYISFKSAVINSEEKKEHYGSHEYFKADLKKGVSFTVLLPSILMENDNLYLPNDTLSLYFEYLYSTGTVSNQFYSDGTVYPVLMKGAVEERKEEHRVEQQKIHPTPVILNDLKSMYLDRLCSDIELRTSTQTYPAHKNILSARSPVFRRMFSNDMKERNSGHVDITDLEDNTIQLMLLYMYTDTLEDLELENACKLYSAADKYEILSLRSRCSTLLKDNLCPTKVCDILYLADLHQDDDLKSAVQDYILKHDTEVFGSHEWRHFMDSNIHLAAVVMYRKVFPG